MKCHDISIYDPNDKGPQRFGQRKLFKGGGGGGTSTTTQNIPEELKPLATAYADKAIGISGQGYTPYGGQRYADLNATQGAGIGMIANRALNGSPVMNTANETLINTLQGGNTNPYLDAMVGKAQQSVVDNYQRAVRPGQVTAQVGSGSFGNSGLAEQESWQQDNLQQNLGDIATSMYGNAYNTDRANQMQALGMAQSYGNQPYQDAQQLMNAGQLLQDQQQQNLDFNYQQFQERENLPYKQLAAMSGVFGSNLGSSATTTQSGGGGK